MNSVLKLEILPPFNPDLPGADEWPGGDERNSRMLNIQATVDGQVLGTSLVLDFALLLVYGLSDAEDLDIFTCSCGNAGCAGVYDSARISVYQDKLRWHFPYSVAKEVAPTFAVEAGQELVITFDSQAYAAELARVLADCEAIRTQEPANLFGLDEGDTPGATIAELIDERREYRLRWDKSVAYRLAVWGEDRNAELVVQVPGSTESIPVLLEWLAVDLAQRAGAESEEEVEALVASTIAPTLRASPGQALAAAQVMTWDEFVSIGLHGAAGPAGGTWPADLSVTLRPS